MLMTPSGGVTVGGVGSDELTAAAAAMAIDLSPGDIDGEVVAEVMNTSNAASPQLDVSDVDKKNLNAERQGQTADEAPSSGPGLTAERVAKRASELFPPGATAPAVKPELPALIDKPTNELARLTFDASARVKRVKGQLAGEEAAGYILADLLGIELLKEEALPLGESIRKAALAAKKADEALQSKARAKKSKLRGKAGAEDGVTAEAIHKIDQKLAEERATLRAAQIHLAGLPDRKSQIVERRAPKPPPAPPSDRVPPADAPAPARAPTPGPGEVAATKELLVELKASLAVGLAIVAAHQLERYVPEMPDESDESDSDTDSDYDEEAEVATVRYKHALRRLEKAFPEAAFCQFDPRDSTVMASEQRMRTSAPCACGGRKGLWPWLLQPRTRGFCACEDVFVERFEWVGESMGRDYAWDRGYKVW